MRFRMLLSVAATAAALLVQMGPSVAPASASVQHSNAHANTSRPVTGLPVYLNQLAQTGSTRSTGCKLNKAVDAVTTAAKNWQNPAPSAARVVVRLANVKGKGVCGATLTTAKAIADVYLTDAAHHRLYTTLSTACSQQMYGQCQGPKTVTIQVGVDARHVRTYTESF